MDKQIRFSCPNPACGKRLKAPPEQAGRQARCSCGQSVVVPYPEPLPPDDPAPLLTRTTKRVASSRVLRPLLDEPAQAPPGRNLVAWLVAGTAGVVLVVGVGVWILARTLGSAEVGSQQPSDQDVTPAGPLLPYKLDADGVVLVEDCTLVLTATAYIHDAGNGKFIYTPAVSLVPAGKSAWTHRLRHPDAAGPGGHGPFAQKVRLIADNIPLKPSLGLQTDDGKFILGEGNSIGPDVTTKEVKKGTRIMLAQPIDVIDPAGKVVATYRPPTGPKMVAIAPLPMRGQEGKAKPDADLQGKWKLTKVYDKYEGGAKSYISVTSTYVMTVKDGDVTVETENDGKKATTKYTLAVDVAKKPKQYTRTSTDEKKTAVTGIYSVEKDTLMMCFQDDGKPPEGFTVTRDDGKDRRIYEFERKDSPPAATQKAEAGGKFPVLVSGWAVDQPTAATHPGDYDDKAVEIQDDFGGRRPY